MRMFMRVPDLAIFPRNFKKMCVTLHVYERAHGTLTWVQCGTSHECNVALDGTNFLATVVVTVP